MCLILSEMVKRCDWFIVVDLSAFMNRVTFRRFGPGLREIVFRRIRHVALPSL